MPTEIERSPLRCGYLPELHGAALAVASESFRAPNRTADGSFVRVTGFTLRPNSIVKDRQR